MIDDQDADRLIAMVGLSGRFCPQRASQVYRLSYLEPGSTTRDGKLNNTTSTSILWPSDNVNQRPVVSPVRVLHPLLPAIFADTKWAKHACFSREDSGPYTGRPRRPPIEVGEMGGG